MSEPVTVMRPSGKAMHWPPFFSSTISTARRNSAAGIASFSAEGIAIAARLTSYGPFFVEVLFVTRKKKNSIKAAAPASAAQAVAVSVLL